MGFTVSASSGYLMDNSENLRNTAKNILTQKGASPEAVHKIVEQALFDGLQMKDLYSNSQVSVLKASTQITLNNSLKETLKYLSSKKSSKKHILGELWEEYEQTDKSVYDGELLDFEIDKNIKNIFAA